MNIRTIQKIVLFSFFGLTLATTKLLAQEVDLFKMQDEQGKKDAKEKTDFVRAAFKTTRIINGQSIENVGRGILDFKILHRFGLINSGGYNFFGFDNGATIRLGLDYGITDRLMVGIGRSSFEKQYDGFVKYRILRQSTGKVNMPISLSYAGTVIWKTLKDNAADSVKIHGSDKFSYVNQLIIARKFNDYFSLQLMPTLVHYNIVPLATDPNDLFSLGIGLRQRVSRRVNITVEYFNQFNKLGGSIPYYNSLSVGCDIETGGHVFQLHLTNSTGMTERTFINETTGNWADGGIHFGFNISRVFTIVQPKEFKTL